MKKILLFITLLLCSIIAHADFSNGVIAYQMKDYDKAYNTMRSLAETVDHSYAQYYLGIMYSKGQGVLQDDNEASEWFKRAAENKVPQAQYKLGKMYMKGVGVPKDYERAYVWFSVGAASRHQASISALEEVTPKLSTDELTEAKKSALSYVSRYGPGESYNPDQPVKIDN